VSIYRTSTLGTASNQITFNLIGAYPYYRMTARQPTRREIVEFDIKLPEGTGDADYQTFIGKTYLILAGTMYPKDEVTYDQGRKALRKLTSLSIQQADADSDQGYVPYKWSESDGYNKQLFVKALYVDLPENSHNGLKQPFRILCKIKYPVIFGQTALTATLGNSTATVSGSSNLPFVLPLALGLTTYSSNGSISNPGDLATYPSFTVIGPISNPRITNTTTGEYIEVDVNLAAASDSLIITYDQDTLSITQAGNSVLSSLTSGSALFKLPAGISQLTLSGATVGTGAYATASALPAWSLS
jgi:Phage tail protein